MLQKAWCEPCQPGPSPPIPTAAAESDGLQSPGARGVLGCSGTRPLTSGQSSTRDGQQLEAPLHGAGTGPLSTLPPHWSPSGSPWTSDSHPSLPFSGFLCLQGGVPPVATITAAAVTAISTTVTLVVPLPLLLILLLMLLLLTRSPLSPPLLL